jgi:hypothetical protein
MTNLAQEMPLVFISHADQASEYASRASTILESSGYQTWVWDHDRPARGDLDIALFKAIQQCKYFAHICSRNTRRSDGQRVERLFAKVLEKEPFLLLVFKEKFLLVFKRNFVPNDIDDRTLYNEVSHEWFDQDCKRAIERLGREQLLTGGAQEITEGQPLGVTFAESMEMKESFQVVVKRGESVERS